MKAKRGEGCPITYPRFLAIQLMGSHSCDLETYPPREGMVNPERNLVKTDNFPQKAATGLSLFSNLSSCLCSAPSLPDSLYCSLHMADQIILLFPKLTDFLLQPLSPALSSTIQKCLPLSQEKSVISFPFPACTWVTAIQEQLIPRKVTYSSFSS